MVEGGRKRSLTRENPNNLFGENNDIHRRIR